VELVKNVLLIWSHLLFILLLMQLFFNFVLLHILNDIQQLAILNYRTFRLLRWRQHRSEVVLLKFDSWNGALLKIVYERHRKKHENLLYITCKPNII